MLPKRAKPEAIEMASYNGNGNGGQRVFHALSIGLSSFSLIMSLVFAFYTVVNPKGDALLIRQEAREDVRRAEDRLGSELLRIKEAITNRYLSKAEHEEFVKRTDRSSDVFRDEISRIRGDQVTRSEHKQHWDETSARIDGVRDLNSQLRREMNESLSTIQKEVGGQYTLGDQIKNLQDQIKLLQSRLDMVRRTGPGTTVN